MLIRVVGLVLGLGLIGCGNPGKDCCDCLIEEDCWGGDDYACYYYYDETYSGSEETPPPAQGWGVDCQKENCELCEEVDENFTD